MFFITYLRRELRRRMRQAIFIALGLALGIGLAVTGKAPKPPSPGSGPPQGGQTFQIGPGGAQVCTSGKCHNAAGQKIDHLESASYGPISQAKVAAISRLRGVKAAAGGLALSDTSITIPKKFGQPGSALPTPSSFNVQGVDTSHLSLGPLSAGTVTAGRSLTGSDARSDVAVVDSGYAKTTKL